MNKKVQSVFMAVVFAVLTAFPMVERADAFCVYNNTNGALKVEQTSGGDFSAGATFYSPSIYPGEKKCCNWQTKSCNNEGGRESIVRFDAWFEDGVKKNYSCRNFPIKAGGWLTVEGTMGGKCTCTAHF